MTVSPFIVTLQVAHRGGSAVRGWLPSPTAKVISCLAASMFRSTPANSTSRSTASSLATRPVSPPQWRTLTRSSGFRSASRTGW